MPWDATELWVAVLAFDDVGFPVGLAGARRVAGGAGQSVIQPSWHPELGLLYLSDRTGWWNVERLVVADGGLDAVAAAGDTGEPEPMAPIEAEIGGPQWVFGLSSYAVLDDGTIAVAATAGGLTRLGFIAPGSGRVELTDTPFTAVGQLRAAPGGRLAMVAASPTAPAAPLLLLRTGTRSLTGPSPENDRAGGFEALRPPPDVGLDPAVVAEPEPIEFPTTGGRTAHALLYRPTNPVVTPPADERPPLLVLSHGGPTSAARPVLDLAKQFWTSRGFAVVDVNYGGSTGFGRPYRERLQGAWGIVDVEDCEAVARHLAAEGVVDGNRLAIRGGSAGGYTTLCALTFGDTFAAGASHYGVADCEALARDTHKFESRYLDGLIGPWPEAAEVYRQRSPIHHTDRLDRPLILFQGLEDEVVPPAQAELMVAALAAKGIPHAYVAFPGEQHGFRRAESIVASLEAELWFYGRVFGFDPADDIAPVEGAVGL
jgi:dipeptidyl aminopeptidase/acylaminoacyl peptidase